MTGFLSSPPCKSNWKHLWGHALQVLCTLSARRSTQWQWSRARSISLGGWIQHSLGRGSWSQGQNCSKLDSSSNLKSKVWLLPLFLDICFLLMSVVFFWMFLFQVWLSYIILWHPKTCGVFRLETWTIQMLSGIGWVSVKCKIRPRWRWTTRFLVCLRMFKV